MQSTVVLAAAGTAERTTETPKISGSWRNRRSTAHTAKGRSSSVKAASTYTRHSRRSSRPGRLAREDPTTSMAPGTVMAPKLPTASERKAGRRTPSTSSVRAATAEITGALCRVFFRLSASRLPLMSTTP